MIDFGIVVIRTTSQHDTVHPMLFYPFQGFHTLVVDVFVKLLVFRAAAAAADMLPGSRLSALINDVGTALGMLLGGVPSLEADEDVCDPSFANSVLRLAGRKLKELNRRLVVS